MMLRQNAQSTDFMGIFVVLGFVAFLYWCMCVASWYEIYIKARQEIPKYAPDVGMSTAVNVSPLYHMQIPKYRRATSPKDDSPV